MHYIDRGPGGGACGSGDAAAQADDGRSSSAIVMLHGNPTWSYFYRNLVEGLYESHRVIAPDHIGMGLSDKPQDAAYDLAFHIDNLERFIEHLDLKSITLVVHDWGAAIGFGYAVNHPDKVEKIIVLNSAAFYDPAIPKRIALCRGPVGKFLVQRLNLFARAATSMTTVNKLSKDTKAAYLRPYADYMSRIGIYSFLADIPVEPNHQTRPLFDAIEARLPDIQSELLILWGKKDFCFTEHFYQRWKAIFPAAQSRLFENAGHYILEDIPNEALKEIKEFIS